MLIFIAENTLLINIYLVNKHKKEEEKLNLNLNQAFITVCKKSALFSFLTALLAAVASLLLLAETAENKYDRFSLLWGKKNSEELHITTVLQ